MVVIIVIALVAFFIAFSFWPEIHEVVWRRWIRRQEPRDMSEWL